MKYEGMRREGSKLVKDEGKRREGSKVKSRRNGSDDEKIINSKEGREAKKANDLLSEGQLKEKKREENRKIWKREVNNGRIM